MPKEKMPFKAPSIYYTILEKPTLMLQDHLNQETNLMKLKD